MKRYNVALFFDAPFEYGGEQRVVIEVMNHLCELYDLTLITPAEKPNVLPYKIDTRIKIVHVPKYTLLKRSAKKIITVFNQKTNLLNNRFLYKVLYRAMLNKSQANCTVEIVKTNKIDIIVGIANRACPLLYEIATRTGVKTVAWMHNSYEAYFETKDRFCFNQDYLFRTILSKLDSCVVLNEDIKQKYKNKLGIDCISIYNPRSFVSDEKAALQNKQFIANGRMNYAKGFDYLLEAFRIFAKCNTEWNLVILGDGPLRKKLESMVGKYGLSERVMITGFVDNVKEYMLSSSVFLLSSRWEGFPMVVTEALELGLPVIAFDIPAMLPLISDGKEGIIVEPFDTCKYAEAMIRLADNANLRREMADRGIKKASTLDINNIINQWCYLFNELPV